MWENNQPHLTRRWIFSPEAAKKQLRRKCVTDPSGTVRTPSLFKTGIEAVRLKWQHCVDKGYGNDEKIKYMCIYKIQMNWMLFWLDFQQHRQCFIQPYIVIYCELHSSMYKTSYFHLSYNIGYVCCNVIMNSQLFIHSKIHWVISIFATKKTLIVQSVMALLNEIAIAKIWAN